ncbi:MAG TPA: NAD(P)/FAD-dependent oxidoreductase [Nitrolancea sp.]|jgi:thioredoxin reductase|nr:NAD(P)/FAD-dependent oxidoreductase [Nitrolancea sp.]
MPHDAIVIGGSFAGLSAAMYIARARRSVAVIDNGSPRNRFAEHSHGFFTQDGSAPEAMLATARAQVAAYPTVTFIQGEAISAAPESDGFSVILATGERLDGRRLVLAFGIRDELPAIPGLAERWGKTVFICPYCHGFEFSDRRLGVLSVSPQSAHQALLISEWGPTTYYLNGGPAPDDETLALLKQREIAIEPAPVRAALGDGSRLSAIEFVDGRTSAVDALYLSTRTHLNCDIAEQLGCAIVDGPVGPIIRTDDIKMTTVPNVFAAGDITRSMHNITFASADGVMAGSAVHRSLIL